MDESFCERFPKAAEQTALQALIHAHIKNGSPEQAKHLPPGLTEPAFEAFKKKIGKEMNPT
ncbi:MAG: hypothetical protein LBJ12_07820 [Oscillospiraceae bacterium]|jgi:hypothetical protein|nr:hypothetical protein [Oscillospiraceae bacterium]